MKSASDVKDAAAAEPGATPALAEWQRLHFPSEADWLRVAKRYPAFHGKSFYELEPWVRLGWPSADIYARVTKAGAAIQGFGEGEDEHGTPVNTIPWAALQERYPEREGVEPREQDLARMARIWPDCFGQRFVEVRLHLHEGSPGQGNNLVGITINNLTYGPGVHRVPASVAVDLRWTDARARQDYIDQFIPPKHKTKVFDMLTDNMVSSTGEIGE